MHCAGCNEFIMSARDGALLSPPGTEGDSLWLCRECFAQVNGFVGSLRTFNERIRRKPSATAGQFISGAGATASALPQLPAHKTEDPLAPDHNSTSFEMTGITFVNP